MLKVDRERLNETAQQFGLDLIVLFGSRAKSRAIPGSDVDIVVRAIKRPWSDWQWEFAVEAALADALKAGGEVDVAFLNGASSLLISRPPARDGFCTRRNGACFRISSRTPRAATLMTSRVFGVKPNPCERRSCNECQLDQACPAKAHEPEILRRRTQALR